MSAGKFGWNAELAGTRFRINVAAGRLVYRYTMPFDNFFEETDKRDFRFGLIVLAVAVAVLSFNYLTDSA